MLHERTKVKDYNEQDLTKMLLHEIVQVPTVLGDRDAWKKEDFDCLFNEFIKTGNEKLRDFLINSHLRLDLYFAKLYLHKSEGMSLLDLFDTGVTGEIEAFDRYDKHKAKFSTYAAFYIKNAIIRYITNDGGRIIRLPVHISNNLNDLEKLREKYIKDFGIEPTTEELATLSGFSVKKIKTWKRYNQQVLSTDYWDGNDFADVPMGDNGAYFDRLEEVLFSEDFIQNLTPREDYIIKGRFGLKRERGVKTLDELGKELGRTREGIRHIQNEALKKMKIKYDKIGAVQ